MPVLDRLPCRICGSAPIQADVSAAFACMHGGMHVNVARHMFMCPTCGLKSVPAEDIVAGCRGLKKQLELWNAVQRGASEEELRQI